jgi:hypothetical protein
MAPTVDGGGASGLPTPPGGLNTTQTILWLAAQQLQDATGKKWDPGEKLVPYLNLAVKEIINLKPEAYPVQKNLTLVAGPVQTLAATDLALIDAVCNMGVSGTVIGTAIRSIKKRVIDALLPDWMTQTANAVVIFVIVDPQAPHIFYTYPPQPAAPSKIQAIVSNYPADLTELDGAFPLDNSYIVATMDYIVGRALMEETTVPNALQKSTQFMQKFMQDLGIKTNTDQQNDAKGK